MLIWSLSWKLCAGLCAKRVNTVDFLDSGNPHEVRLGPGRRDTAVLQPGASGVAIMWRGRYTNLDVASIDFVTDQNPVGQQGLWTLFALILWAPSLAWHVMNRRSLRSAPTDPPS